MQALAFILKEVEKMKKEISLLAVAVSLLTVSAAFAHEEWHPFKVTAKGFAVSTDYPNTFKLVKIKLGFRVSDNETAVFWRGVMKVNSEKLQINNVTVSNNTVTGNLYRNGTLVGSFTVTSTTTDEKKVWFGTMALDNQTYRLYLLAKRHRHKWPIVENEFRVEKEINKEFKINKEFRAEIKEKNRD